MFSRGKSRNRPTPRLLIGEPAPAFNYKSFAGEDISLKKLSGKLVVLDFWETWCGHCQQAFPDVNKLQQKWGDRLVVIGVVSENKGEVQKVLDNADLSYQTIFADPNMVMEYHVNGRPTYFVIGPDGVVVECSVGNLKPIEAAVEKLFTKDSDSPQTTNDRVK